LLSQVQALASLRDGASNLPQHSHNSTLNFLYISPLFAQHRRSGLLWQPALKRNPGAKSIQFLK